MVKTVIVPLDGSAAAERALAPAVVLARQADAELVLTASRLGGPAEAASYLESVSRRLSDVRVRTVAFDDRLAFDAIMTLAERAADPVVCMLANPRGGTGRGPYGATTQDVVRLAEWPVLLVGPACADMAAGANVKEMVVCLDGSPTAVGILPTAVEWARELGLELWLVGVVDPETAAAAARIGDDVHESTAMERVAHELRRSDVDVNWDVLHGPHAAAAIVEFARERSAPIIAMTTHGRTGLSRVVAGSVTLAVVRDAPCPVLVTRSRDLGS